MEPEEHIIEKYFQEVLGCSTMTNIKCKGNKEIDLLAIDPKSHEKFHVESRVSTAFKLKIKSTYNLKNNRCNNNGLDYFWEKKFNDKNVLAKIEQVFGDKTYNKILVVWDYEGMETPLRAKLNHGIEIILIREMIERLVNRFEISGAKGSRDHVLRTIELISQALKEEHVFKRNVDKQRIVSYDYPCPFCGHLNKIDLLKTYERNGELLGESHLLYSVRNNFCEKCRKFAATESELIKIDLSRI